MMPQKTGLLLKKENEKFVFLKKLHSLGEDDRETSSKIVECEIDGRDLGNEVLILVDLETVQPEV